MRQRKLETLAAHGYRVATTRDFLGLSDEEMSLIDLKVSLIRKIKKIRNERNITQQQLAGLIHASQSRVAMLGRGRPEASLDLICRALFALGVSRRKLGKAIISGRAA